MPYPPRMAILPSPLGSKAKPMRGARLNRCPLRQPALEEEPMFAVGKFDPGTKGRFPPGPPHWTKPFSGLAVLPVFCARDPSELNVGSWAGLNTLGLKLKACR